MMTIGIGAIFTAVYLVGGIIFAGWVRSELVTRGGPLKSLTTPEELLTMLAWPYLFRREIRDGSIKFKPLGLRVRLQRTWVSLLGKLDYMPDKLDQPEE